MDRTRVRRRWVVILALTAVLVVSTACGAGEKKTGTTVAAQCPLDALKNAKKPVEITFWHAIFAAQNEAVLRKLTDEFNASQHDVRVKLVQNPSLDENLDKYRTGLATGAGLPDLIQLAETSVQTMVDSKSTVPIQACVDADHYALSDYLPRAIDYYTTEGVLRAMPWTVGDPVLYYDKTAFQKAGLDPDRPPRTLDEVREDSKKIVASGAAKHGIALHIDGYYPEYWFAKANRQYVDNGNGRSARATKILLDNDTGRKIFTWWDDMVRSGLALDTGSQPNNFDHLLSIGNGNAAMAFEAAAGLGPITKILESGQYSTVRVGVGPLPGPGPDGGMPVGDSTLWIVSRSAPERQAAAWQFVKFLDKPANLATLHVEAGYVPIRKSVVDEPAVKELWRKQPAFRVGYDQLVQGPRTAATAGAVIGDYQGVRAAVRDALSRMLAGGVSPEQALQQAQRDANARIAEYNSRVAGG